MAVMSRLLPLVAYSTFAIFLLALMATPTNALVNEPHAHVARGHDNIAKRKRNIAKRAKRCRPKTTSLVAASATPSTSAASSTSTPTATTTSRASSSHVASTTSTTSHSSSAAAAPTTTKPATSKSSSSSAAAATSTSVSTGSSGSTGLDPNKKLLLAWPNGPTDLEKYQYGTRVGGMYTWSPYCPDNTYGITCFQQLWGSKQTSAFTSLVNPKKSNLVFGFNEPNQGDQSNMSAQDGAALWNQLIKPLKSQGAKLVSPATTSATSGKTWIQDMMKACGSDQCQFDFIALHWYGTSIDSFKAYVDDWYKTFGKPLIISEYACQDFSGGAQCTTDQTNTFHYTMGAWFDQHPGVAMLHA
ncbi:unnamed protein product [Rhizoctonia solani]|uniref:Asl1-like glycosyl hydrolase catalytic domain-containing protein n=1 Tax=Rhizoctonia solani TaxID=456999 RepID=A0A8H3DCW2_9AGAM|nr:unnamed protein product [Rhizoctonia solani]